MERSYPDTAVLHAVFPPEIQWSKIPEFNLKISSFPAVYFYSRQNATIFHFTAFRFLSKHFFGACLLCLKRDRTTCSRELQVGTEPRISTRGSPSSTFCSNLPFANNNVLYVFLYRCQHVHRCDKNHKCVTSVVSEHTCVKQTGELALCSRMNCVLNSFTLGGGWAEFSLWSCYSPAGPITQH